MGKAANMHSRNRLYKLATNHFVITFLIVLAVFAFVELSHYQRRVANALDIWILPSSVEITECKDAPAFTSDVLWACHIRLDGADFDRLLEGYEFQDFETIRQSHELVPMKVGPDFKVARIYQVEPFEHGGWIRLLTNGARTTVVIDVYIE